MFTFSDKDCCIDINVVHLQEECEGRQEGVIYITCVIVQACLSLSSLGIVIGESEELKVMSEDDMDQA